MWIDFGFKKNPYDTHPVKGDAEGEKLLVGRKQELRNTKNRIVNVDSVVTVEGPNGVGKTSLVLVAAYQIDRETQKNGRKSIVLIPEPFQFTAEESALEFKRKVYARIASHFIENEKEYRSRLDLQFNLGPLARWLENPVQFTGGASVAGMGLSGGRNPNTSTGFDLHGFFNIVDTLLSRAFAEGGGVICILDNLEILNTSQKARQRLEELRDDLFSKHGIKWVVCGARGIVKSTAGSARLQGRLQEPLEINPVDKSSITELISARVKQYQTKPDSVPPVGVRSFEHLFLVLNENLRDSLKFAGDFALWLFENDNYKPDADDLHELFEVWLADQSQRYLEAINVPPRAWKLFDDICAKGGSISPSDYEEFDFNSPQNMRGQIAKLESAEVVNSEVDETDHRRKTITVTAKGWLLRYFRSGLETESHQA